MYIGAMPFLTNETLQDVSAILSTEARHAAYVATDVVKVDPWGGPFDVFRYFDLNISELIPTITDSYYHRRRFHISKSVHHLMSTHQPSTRPLRVVDFQHHRPSNSRTKYHPTSPTNCRTSHSCRVFLWAIGFFC